MKYTKVEESKGDCMLVYFVDQQKQKQGELLCYRTEGKLPSEDTLLFIEEYKDGLLLDRKWMKLPEPIFV